MGLRYTRSLLRILRIPGLLAVIKDWQAFIRMHFIFAAYESGLLKAMPCDRETLIDKLHVKRPDLLDALLDVGLATKELAIKHKQFFIKGKRSKAIVNAKGDMLAAMIQANVTYYSDAYRRAADRMQGAELGDDLCEIGDLVARYSKVAEPIVKDFIRVIVAGKDPMRVLDVGCGSAVFLQTTHSANRNATGVGLDSDEAVVRQAKENLATWGLGDQFDIILGDIRRPPEAIAGPFDLISLYNILYYFHDEERAELLHNLRAMLSPGGVLAVVTYFRSRGKDLGAANLNLVNCSLKGLTPLPDLDEVVLLLRQCGFGRIDVHRFMPGSTFCGIVARNS